MRISDWSSDVCSSDLERLYHDLGVVDMLWLGDGLLNDHTDGHVDNLARFVGPARLAIPEPTENDPNSQVYQRAAQRADMFGRIALVRLPSPGPTLHGTAVVPARHLRFHSRPTN